MTNDNYITMGGASFLACHVLSFQSEKDFLKEYENSVYLSKPIKERREILKQIYRIAKKQEEK